jgi:hypothetical protein
MEQTPTFADFNPTDNPDVDHIKQTTDALIAFVKAKANQSPDAARHAALAATNYEQAAMWAVKALFS